MPTPQPASTTNTTCSSGGGIQRQPGETGFRCSARHSRIRELSLHPAAAAGRTHVLLLPLGHLGRRLPEVDLHLAMRICSSRRTHSAFGAASGGRLAGGSRPRRPPPLAISALWLCGGDPTETPHLKLLLPAVACSGQWVETPAGVHGPFCRARDPPAANPRLWGNCLPPRVTRLARGTSLRRAALMVCSRVRHGPTQETTKRGTSHPCNHNPPKR